jgi:hypothetical protein
MALLRFEAIVAKFLEINGISCVLSDSSVDIKVL